MIRNFINTVVFKLKNRTCKVEHGVRISRKVKVGKNCFIGRNTVVASNVILGDNVRIHADSSLRNLEVGNNSVIESGLVMPGTGKGRIIIGKECYIGVNNVLDTSDNITLGDFVHVAGPSTGLWCHSSAKMCLNSIPLNDLNKDEFRPTARIIIESNVYIGGNCTLYPGITIGDHSIITPNSAVVKSFSSHSFIGGVPAVVIKMINLKN